MYNCTECDRLYSLQRGFLNLEDLETHICNDHFKVFVYECERCPYAKFPTEGTLVDHYAVAHDLKDNLKIKYVLDEATREMRRKIQECLIQSATNAKQNGPLVNELRKKNTSLPSSKASVIEVDITETEDDEEVGGRKGASSRRSGPKINFGKSSRGGTSKSSTTSEYSDDSEGTLEIIEKATNVRNGTTRQLRKNAKPEKLEMPLTPRRTPRRLSSTLAEEKIHSYQEMEQKIMNSLRKSNGLTRGERAQNRTRKST